jgi:hypothetical protein
MGESLLIQWGQTTVGVTLFPIAVKNFSSAGEVSYRDAASEERLADCLPALALVVVSAGNASVDDGVPLCQVGGSLVARLIGSGRA